MKSLLVKVGILFFVFQSLATHALTESEMWKSVFQVVTYTEDAVSGNFSRTWLGSAVLIGKNRIITNAHVVLDDKEKLTGLYEICRLVWTKKVPECFTSGKVIAYDVVTDLAILELANPVNDITPPTIATNELNIWDDIIVYWYPGIGGSSITRTSGKMAGIESEDYKFDGTIDHGNSGGGAFDTSWKLVGIPYSVASDNGVIGYIIPSKTVNTFLKGKTNNYTKVSKSAFNKTFQTYLTRAQKLYKGSLNIKTPYVNISGLNKANLRLVNVIESNDGKIFDYRFLTKDDRVGMFVKCNKVVSNTKRSAEEIFTEYTSTLTQQNSNFSILKKEKKGDMYITYISVNDPATWIKQLFVAIDHLGTPCWVAVLGGEMDKDAKTATKVVEVAKKITFTSPYPALEKFVSKFLNVDTIPEEMDISEWTGFPEPLITVQISTVWAINGFSADDRLDTYEMNTLDDYMNIGYDESNYYRWGNYSFETFANRFKWENDPESGWSYVSFDTYKSKNGKSLIISESVGKKDDGLNTEESEVMVTYPFKLGEKLYIYQFVFTYNGRNPDFVQKIIQIFQRAELPGVSPFK